MTRRLVVALGGNALSRRGEPIVVDVMRARVAEAASEIARVCGRDELVVTHGNGPQIGLLALASDTTPLEVLGAESEGMIGFLLEEALAPRMPDREVATLLTQVEVDPEDPAFRAPDKPIGPVYGREEADRIARERGWTMAADGDRVRRVVASPQPRRVREIAVLERLVEANVVTVCAGGGGVPVVVDGAGVRGVAAVVDKDATAALLAEALDADALVLLTDVSAVFSDWPAANEPLGRVAPRALRAMRFPRGSMGPKVDAACRFAERTGRPAFIGALGALASVLEGTSGTRVALA